MTHETPPDFAMDVQRLVAPIVASERRKRGIEEELFAHMLDAYEEELAHRGDARAAHQAVRRRFGAAAEIGEQLQAAVPRRERILHLWLGHAETFMARYWIAGLVVFLAAFAFVLPENAELSIGALAMLVGMGFVRACQQSPAWRAWWPWVTGTAAIAIGPALILPAMALWTKQDGDAIEALGPAALGAFILLAGVAVIVWAVAFRRKPLA